MSLVVEVELLAGRYTATQYDDRLQPEWPPHPARLFHALVATWAEAEDPDPAERAALTWLEALDPPTLTSSDAIERTVLTHYVPVNDAATVRDLSKLYQQLEAAIAAVDELKAAPGKERQRAERTLARLRAKAVTDSAGGAARAASAPVSGLQLLPDLRGRQPRTYPTVRPDDPRVFFTWEAEGGRHREALDRLLRRVVRLGHSSTPVACRLAADEPAPTHVPDPDGVDLLRVPAAGLLDTLEQQYAFHQGVEPRVLPTRTTRYSPARPAMVPLPEPLLAGEWFVLARRDGVSLPVHRALAVTVGVRGALQRHGDQPVPEVISGHRPGAPGERTAATDRPHLAIVPLPFVGHQHADGAIFGVALVLPTGIDSRERDQVLRALSGWRDEDRTFPLRLGRLGSMRLELADELESRQSLLRSSWCRPSKEWATVTPVALDRFPRHLTHQDPARREAAEAAVEATIRAACVYAGFPEPATVAAGTAPFVVGVPPLRAFPTYRSASGTVTRRCLHVALRFATPVRGPVLIGAGRYLGYGLCRPLREEYPHG